MPKLFAAYCLIILILLTVANQQGYVISSYLPGGERADRTVTHYQYHK